MQPVLLCLNLLVILTQSSTPDEAARPLFTGTGCTGAFALPGAGVVDIQIHASARVNLQVIHAHCGLLILVWRR